jgi:hypothetical protein
VREQFYHPQFFTATILEWKHLLKPDKYKELIIESLRFLVREKRVEVFAPTSASFLKNQGSGASVVAWVCERAKLVPSMQKARNIGVSLFQAQADPCASIPLINST